MLWCPLLTSHPKRAFGFFPQGEVVNPKPSSWSTSAEDIAAGNPYPLWSDKDNEIHRLQWEHLRLCIEMVNKAQECSDSDECGLFGRIARGFLDAAEHSCQFWWASRRPHWEVNMVFRGLADQGQAALNASRSVELSGASRDQKRLAWRRRLTAVELYRQVMDELVRT